MKAPLRTKSIGTKVSEEEFAALEATARGGWHTPSTRSQHLNYFLHPDMRGAAVFAGFAKAAGFGSVVFPT